MPKMVDCIAINVIVLSEYFVLERIILCNCTVGNLIVLLMGIHCSIALKIFPSFQHYNDTTELASLICIDDNNDYVSGDDVEWLSPNFTLLMSSPDYRIYGIAS